MNRLLAEGAPRINPDLSVSILDDFEQEIHRLPALALTNGGIGYVYERVVSIHYSSLGYVVTQRANLGFLDQGVDLVAERDDEKVFVQCKFTISRQKVESLLYAASRFVKSNLGPQSNYFDLAIPSKSIAFPEKKKPRRGRGPASAEFLKYNQTQTSVRLRIEEVPINLPDEFSNFQA